MSETIFREMNNVDPNERVQVGSYRVDGHGHQQLKDVTLLFLLFNYIYVSFQTEIISNVGSNEKFTLKLRLFSRSHSDSHPKNSFHRKLSRTSRIRSMFVCG